MTLSARNHLKEAIDEIQVGDVLRARHGASRWRSHRIGDHETQRRRNGRETLSRWS